MREVVNEGLTATTLKGVPALREAVAIRRRIGTGDPTPPIETEVIALVMQAAPRLQLRHAGAGILALFGISMGSEGADVNERRANAAAQMGQSLEDFADYPERELLRDLARAVRDICQELPPLAPIPEPRQELEPRPKPADTKPESDLPVLARSTPNLVLKVGEVINAKYEIMNPTPEVDGTKLGFAKWIGHGGAGKVYRAKFSSIHDRAIKFLTSDTSSDRTGQRLEDFRRTFENEREFLSRLSHGNIARLHDLGTYEDVENNAWHYLVTEYVDGGDLKETLEDPGTSPSQTYALISDVLAAVCYLHANGVLHSDIKFENIRCRKSKAGLQAVLLDFGASVYINDHSADTIFQLWDERHLSHWNFISTSYITHERFRDYIGEPITVDRLSELFPAHDIYGVGVLLQTLWKSKGVEANLREVFGEAGMRALAVMVRDLLETPVERHYTEIEQVRKDWEKLPRSYLSPANVPELSLAADFKLSISTASGRALITQRLANLIDHKMVQRLRRVPHLGMSQLTFVGATHTRLSHSIAVLRNTRYYLSHLLNDPVFRLWTEPHDLQATLILALLHDVGHFQLCQLFEDYAADQRANRQNAPWSQISFDVPFDDDLFFAIVDPGSVLKLRGNYSEKIRTAVELDQEILRSPQRESLKELIIEGFDLPTYEALKEIHRAAYFSARTDSNAHMVLAAVLSSDIDADKVSYLREDALRSGMPYGEGVDFDGLVGSLRAPSPRDITRPSIGITRHGLAAAESVVLNRVLMMGRVYWHHSNRAATAMVKYVISSLLQNGQLDLPDFVAQSLFMEYEEALSVLSAKFETCREQLGWQGVNPVVNLIHGEKGLYRTVFSTARLSNGEDIAKKLVGFSLFTNHGIDHQLATWLSRQQDIGPVANGEVLLDVPSWDRSRSNGSTFVYKNLISEAGQPLLKESPILRELSNEHLQKNVICRVFVAPRLYSQHEFKISEVLNDYFQRLLASGLETD